MDVNPTFAPEEWAMLQNNLGNVLSRLGHETGDISILHEAQAAYLAALRERTQERAPRDWAATTYNLGGLLITIGRKTDDPGVLRQAISAFRSSLEERTRKRLPRDWAQSQLGLGTALEHLSDLVGDIRSPQPDRIGLPCGAGGVHTGADSH